MNILYDNIIFELQRSGGISLYWSELSKQHLLAKENAIAFLERNSVRSGNFHRRNLHLPWFGIVRYRKHLPLAVERYLPIAKQLNFDVFHSSYYRCMSQKADHGVSIVTAHDFIYERYVKGIRKALHVSQKYKALSRADGIICISESTKRDLLNFYPELGGKPMKVIYNGVSHAYSRLEEDVSMLLPGKYHITLPFMLYVGARTASYKNFRLVVDAMKANSCYNLVLVGGGDLEPTERHMLNSHLHGRYQHLQYIPESDLNLLYNAAHCLLYLSSYEGFGLPILEAQQAGCPVIAFHNSSIPELAACPESLLQEKDPALVNGQIINLERPSYREQYTKPGILKSQSFSWEKCYEETLLFYKEVMQHAESSRSTGRVRAQRIIREESHV